jgi:TonB-dependent receptor
VASLDAKYDLGARQRRWLKAGTRWRRQESGDTTGSRRFAYVGADGITGVNPGTGVNDDDLSPFQTPGLQRTADYRLGAIPFVHTATAGADVEKNPARWREDVYFRESERLSGTRKVTEDVSSVYLMGSARWGKLGVLAGARVEETEVTGQGWARRTTLANIADPVLRAATEYGARKQVEGSYTDVFPGVHGTYVFARGLLGRASWSTSIGRPAFSNLVPREDVNVTNQTVTINNPSLSPQYSDNLDVSLEYYFEPVGLLSVGAFQKQISEFIFTDEGGVVGSGASNGYEGQYAGYTIITQNNGGSARIRGWEASYQQELTFLPAGWRGFGVFANYTYLTTEGDYGGTTTRTSNQVARFVPRSANGGLSFKRDRFNGRLLANYVGEHLYTYSTDPSRLRYKMARTLTNLSLNYQLRRGVTVYCDFNNLLQAPQRYYIGAGKTNRLQAYLDNGPSLNVGLSGSF